MTDETTKLDDRNQWRTLAACRGMNVQLFYPEKWDLDTIAAAIAVCETCPVQQTCLDEAIERREPGIWGGLTERRRRIMAAKIGRRPYAAPILHGTEAGYKMHHRRSIPTCDACRIAHQLAQQRRRIEKDI